MASALVRLKIPARPSLKVARSFALETGAAAVAGIDEAGRGPLAGPVVAAAVIFPLSRCPVSGLQDSKLLSAVAREELFGLIVRKAIAYGIGLATAEEIDRLNILEATRLAARRALLCLRTPAGALITDALPLPGETRPVLPLIKGDRICACVSAASILAKVSRDWLMTSYATEHPEFGFEENAGYGTQHHREALRRFGPCIHHRRTFAGVREYVPEAELWGEVPARLSFETEHQRFTALLLTGGA